MMVTWCTSWTTLASRGNRRIEMTFHWSDPLRDPRWADFVGRHPRASVFHTSGWLEALRRTYGYEPLAVTTSAPGSELRTAVVFCQVRSWLTGTRLVSVPFADHCEPLVEAPGQLHEICSFLQAARHKNGWSSIELRPQQMTPAADSGMARSERYWIHQLDLSPDLRTLFRAFHKDSIQRKIQRAHREKLTCDEGRDDGLLGAFHGLLALTRRRHGLPPQPIEWFRNLAACLGPAMKVRIASRLGEPIAGILTIRHRDTMVYKYGASNAAFHSAGGMQLLLWKAIEEAHDQGCVAFDLGRSDLEQEGLLVFKDRWGATRRPLTYWRYPAATPARARIAAFMASHARQVLSHAPEAVGMAAGRLLYRHIG